MNKFPKHNFERNIFHKGTFHMSHINFKVTNKQKFKNINTIFSILNISRKKKGQDETIQLLLGCGTVFLKKRE